MKKFVDGTTYAQGLYDVIDITIGDGADGLATEFAILQPGTLCGVLYPPAWTAAVLSMRHQLPGLGIGTVTAASVSVNDTVTINDGVTSLVFTAKNAESIAAREFNQAAGNDAAATSLAACINASGLNVTATSASAVVTITAGPEAVVTLTSSNGTRLAVVSPWKDVQDTDGTLVALTVTAGQYRLLNPASFAGLAAVQLRSGTTASAVQQAAARTVRLVLRRNF